MTFSSRLSMKLGREKTIEERRLSSLASNRKILLIEDEESIATPLSKLLSMRKFDVEWAPNAKKGLELLESGATPGCILVDIMMPQMNGWEFRERQRASKNEWVKKVPVIFLSADADSKREAENRNEKFVSKPIDFDDLTNTLENVFKTGELL